jgi:hypothetical protein
MKKKTLLERYTEAQIAAIKSFLAESVRELRPSFMYNTFLELTISSEVPDDLTASDIRKLLPSSDDDSFRCVKIGQNNFKITRVC